MKRKCFSAEQIIRILQETVAAQRRLRSAQAVPALLLNTTEVVTGERMVVSHLTWTNEEKTTEGAPGQPTTSDAPRNGNKPPWPWLLQDYAAEKDVPLKAAAFLSARFPYVTPCWHDQGRT